MTLAAAETRLGLRNRAPLAVAGLALILGITIVVALGSGALWMPPGRVLAVLADALGLPFHGAAIELRERAVLLDIRLPRVVLGVLVGGSLAWCGALLQGLFRNPLADPGLIGVSSGAAFCAVGAIVFGVPLLQAIGLQAAMVQTWLVPAAAFVGGLLATLLIQAMARREGGTDIATMLLAGIAVGAMAGAGIGLLVYLSDDRQLRDIAFWNLGSLGAARWPAVLALALCLLPGLLLATRLAHSLNALMLGEREAGHLGIAVEREKRLIIVVVALAVGASVAACGAIGFVGLVVPHLVRLSIGPDHRLVLPASALLGASLLLLADIGARTLAAPAELPIGALTSALGGPFFLWLLRRRRGGVVS